METIHLGEVPACNEAIILPLTADVSGTWAFITNFNGAYKYKAFQATATESITVPVSLNENYTYTFKLYKPGTLLFNDVAYSIKTMPMLPDIDYTCESTDGDNITTTITARKKQTIATHGQTEAGDNAFIHAKQLMVFIEGALRQEGNGEDEYIFNTDTGAVIFNAQLIAGQKITILYFK